MLKKLWYSPTSEFKNFASISDEAQALKIISRGIIDVHHTTLTGQTVLHIAITKGYSSAVVKPLLDLVADINATDVYGNTPLYLLCCSRLRSEEIQLPILDLMLDRNADPFILPIPTENHPNWENIMSILMKKRYFDAAAKLICIYQQKDKLIELKNMLNTTLDSIQFIWSESLIDLIMKLFSIDIPINTKNANKLAKLIKEASLYDTYVDMLNAPSVKLFKEVRDHVGLSSTYREQFCELSKFNIMQLCDKSSIYKTFIKHSLLFAMRKSSNPDIRDIATNVIVNKKGKIANGPMKKILSYI